MHPSNPVKNLTLDQLKAIYDGSIKNWKEVGGKDENIVVISRDTSSGTYEMWHEKVMKKADVHISLLHDLLVPHLVRAGARVSRYHDDILVFAAHFLPVFD